MAAYDYVHVDVFAERVLEGNGLAMVFAPEWGDGIDGALMLELAREFKQFETIFLSQIEAEGGPLDGCVRVAARIFTMEGELPFAGHPVLGGAAALHARLFPTLPQMQTTFRLSEKEVPVDSRRTDEGYNVEMAQGRPSFGLTLSAQDAGWLAFAHNLKPDSLYPGLPVEVVTTGLPYVLIPVTTDLSEARITVRDLAQRIGAWGARYTYLFNPDTLEARTWDNLGLVEDSATGSAAGPVCAYLVRHGRAQEGELLTIHQGRYAGRPGVLRAMQRDGAIFVSGGVMQFATGTFSV